MRRTLAFGVRQWTNPEVAAKSALRRAFELAALLVVTSLLVAYFLSGSVRTEALERLATEQRDLVRVKVRDVGLALAGSSADVRLLADRLARVGDLAQVDAPAAVDDELGAFLRYQTRYDRVRVFDAGAEPVAQLAEGGAPPSSAPQSLSDRLVASLTDAAGTVRVHGPLEAADRSPRGVAIVRLATPIVTPDGRMLGIMVAETDGDRLLGGSWGSVGGSGTSWLLGSRGGWLRGTAPDREQAGLPSAGSFAAAIPEVWATITTGPPEGSLMTARGAWVAYGRLGGANGAVSSPEAGGVIIDGATWTVVTFLPEALLAPLTAGMGARWGLALSWFIFSVAAASALAARSWYLRDKAEQRTRDSEIRFRALLAASPDPIFVLDRRGTIVFFSPRAEVLLGYRGDDVMGESIGLLAAGPGEDLAVAAEPWLAPLTAGVGTRRTCELRHTDGRRVPVIAHLRPVELEQGAFVLCVTEDVTNKEQAEREIVELNTHLERQTVGLFVANERLSARTRELEAINAELEAFTYSAAHDLRTPLRGLDGFSRILIERYEAVLDDRGRGYLVRIRAAAQRMGALLDDLLRLSWSTTVALRWGKIDLSAAALSIAKGIAEGDRERKVEWEIAEGLAAHGDRRLVALVLENLLDNAWKYSGRRADAHIVFGSRREDDETVYFVRDNGVGFDPDHAGRLFQPFQRLHTPAEFPGSGVGLALVQRVVHRHGGCVWAEGEVDRGATFCFTLGHEAVGPSGSPGSDETPEDIQESA
jgi:PAS domain S-box-containing protein